MSIYNPYRHAKRKSEPERSEKMEVLKERMNTLRHKYRKDPAVFELHAATIFHEKGIVL